MTTPTPPTTPRDLLEPLSAREQEVVRLLACGLSDGAIATELRISTIIVRHHMASVREKLGCHSRVQVLLMAQAHGLLQAGADAIVSHDGQF